MSPLIARADSILWQLAWELTFTRKAHTQAPSEQRGTTNSKEDPAPRKITALRDSRKKGRGK